MKEMKIVRFTAENVKRLKAVEIVPDGSVVEISGPNGQGKSSVLDAIYYALAGAKELPAEPVRCGCHKAMVRLDLGEVIVTRRFTAQGGTSLTVEASNGARFPSPQKLLDDLLGSLTFDPLAFARMKPKDQLEQLRRLVQLDVDIDNLDAQNTADYERRTELNRCAKQLQAQIDAIVVPESLPEAPENISALLQQMEQLSTRNAEIEREQQRRQQRQEVLNSLRLRLKQLQEEMRRVTEDGAKLRAEIDAWSPLPELMDAGSIRTQIEQARTANDGIERRMQRDSLQTKLETLERQISDVNSCMQVRLQQKQDAIAKAKMPIEGLTFDDGQVLYKNLPLEQASDAERLRVSTAIAMAANPKLRVLRIKDGSLLDDHSMQLLHDMASAGDYQVWIETVRPTGPVAIVMRDGEIEAQA
jgi:DNA repair exonuclease SbcCD ATPase subunit